MYFAFWEVTKIKRCTAYPKNYSLFLNPLHFIVTFNALFLMSHKSLTVQLDLSGIFFSPKLKFVTPKTVGKKDLNSLCNAEFDPQEQITPCENTF